RSYVSLLGEDEFSTILDGEGLSNILFSENDNNFSIENMTIQNGFNGIYCNNSSPSLENVTVLDNSDSGIYCDNSSPSLENVTVLDNSNSGIYCDSSSPSLQNVTITGNSTSGYYADGGGIYCYESSPILQNVTIVNNSAYSEYGASSNGGGIYCENSSLILQNVTITGNSAVWYGRGGGIYCEDNSSLSLENVTITGNSADDKGGGIYLYYSSISFSVDNRCNIYSNTIGNTRGFGVDMYAVGFDTRHVILDTFTVMTPTDYYASPINNFTFDILHSIIDSLINADVYVSVDGDNSNSGTSPDLPFKTINHALSRIYSDSLNINTIHLAPGIYSNSTNGEVFPIHWSNYVNLSGSNEDETILDAEGTSRVMNFNAVTNAILNNITITNGYSIVGGGIYCHESSPSLENVT
ncbi:MAG: right-handed parallel beta-helix repeat-containing protein, partial [Candidatus Cloacimonetes bacterium]|nr:right-handed parallel beta-helix repeat-containing protein [Candidatus Cloacimonadota bacterium]